jgi:ribosomal protein S17
MAEICREHDLLRRCCAAGATRWSRRGQIVSKTARTVTVKAERRRQIAELERTLRKRVMPRA